MAQTLVEIVLTMARMGHYIIIDDVAFGKCQVDIWKDALKDYKVIWIGLKAPLDILETKRKRGAIACMVQHVLNLVRFTKTSSTIMNLTRVKIHLTRSSKLLRGAMSANKLSKHIVVLPYNPEWPKIFVAEAQKIKKALGDNCIAVHHVGSTSVPGLSAKPVIDMIVIIKDPEKVIQQLESLGFKSKGEYNIPMRLYFNRSEGIDANLHVYEDGHPEIELNLLFRDYLRDHPEVREEYAILKKNLLKDSASFEKRNSMFTGYNLGKDAFIRKVLKAANFNRIRLMRCSHYVEWDMAKTLRQKYFFDPLGITDPYTWTFDHKDHVHFILYQGVEMMGYAHIQFWPNHRAALRIIVIDEPYRNHSFGSQFLQLCEQWLKKQGIHSLHDEARPETVRFYRNNGYTEMPFEDPSGEPPSQQDVAMGKKL
jgi:GrpB-like predicted nucleotidyltransferase (UPF0157 family)/GNAT superfamily N-acetyltransferase